ncbi:hypothetical protein J4466_00255 [Candidatus Pacearchaeota archaeon]|nr:hypothetical protein [Candidatus Pacearchaeota archaeon]
MRKIKGYICAARIEEIIYPNIREYVLFGKKQDAKIIGNHEALATNNLTAYENLPDAELGLQDLAKMDEFDRVEVRKLEMWVAENAEELYSFEKENSLVVIWDNFMGKQIIGVYTGGRGLSTLPGDYIIRNGFKPFNNFERANWARSEASRQSGSSPATLAKFKISKPLRVIGRRGGK